MAKGVQVRKLISFPSNFIYISFKFIRFNCMKTIYSICFLSLFSVSIYGQTLSYVDLQVDQRPKGQFESYEAKDGTLYKIGDKIQFAVPSGVNGKFVTITKIDVMGNIYPVGSEVINTSAEIKKIMVGGLKRSGWKAGFQTKGLTAIDNYFFNIEDAITAGEIKSKAGEALSELKKAKEKLDLGLITQDEYDSLKVNLAKFIK